MSEKKIDYTLTENALDFIHEAIGRYNFYKENDGERQKKHLKYCVLHISSGIELLLKQRLYNEHWSYIVDNLDDKGLNIENFQDGNFRSVDSNKSIERLGKLCKVCFKQNELKTLKQLRDKRNKLEHFALTDSRESLLACIIDSLHFALNFIDTHFKYLEMSQEKSISLQPINEALKDLEEFQEKRCNLITHQIQQDGINPESLFMCPGCLRKFYLVEDCDSKCLFCDHKEDPDKMAHFYLSEICGLSDYIIFKDGGEWPQFTCPGCGNEALVVRDDRYFCFSCNTTFEYDELSSCISCGEMILDRSGIDMCGNCCDCLFNED